jgi:siroheme synthase-like protein
MGFYPLLVELEGRRVVVIGGGVVGERKIEGLLAARADVTVVSPDLTPALTALAQAGRIARIARPYRQGDLEGAALVFTALGDPQVTAAVADEARRRNIWLNAADDPAHCSFILPAVVRRGPLTIAVASGGATPALTRALREHLDGALGPEWAALAELAAEARRELRASGRSADGETWRRALADDVRALVAARRLDEARRELRARLAMPA